MTIHQGRIERILEVDLRRYSKRGVQRDTTLIDVRIDEQGDADFPVLAEIQTDDELYAPSISSGPMVRIRLYDAAWA